MASCLAFVSVAGFNALADAQKNYLVTFPKNATPPSAPGSLMHPTVISPSLNCGAPPPILTLQVNVVGSKDLTCDTINVFDQFDPSDPKTPQGVIHLYLDASTAQQKEIASCTLPSTVTTGPKNSCTLPSWTPDSSYYGTHTLTAVYVPTSNHFGYSSGPETLVIGPGLKLTALNCVNEAVGGPDNQVEIGHPLTCQVSLKDLTTGTTPANVPVVWTDTTATGLPLFSCYSGGSAAAIQIALWSPPCAPANPSPASACTTNTSGMCSVVYRDLDNPMTNTGVAVPHQLTVTASYQPGLTSPVFTYSFPWQVNVTRALSPHPVQMWMKCPGSAPATFVARGFGTFQATNTLTLHSGNTVDCTAYVIDSDPNAILDCVNPSCLGNPDVYDAHPPIGQVTWTASSGATVSGPSTSCTLARAMPTEVPLAPPTTVIPNQTPYASSCGVSGLKLIGTGTGTLTATFAETGIPLPGEHRSSATDVAVNFTP